MTQRSQPAADHINNFPTSDAGPYSADEWSDMFACLFSTDVADQGPIIRYLNELEVTDDGADIDVDTGAAMADGHWFKNDVSEAFTIPHPAANPRIDRVVVCVNNTAVAMTVSDLGFALDFPDNLADYNGTNSIEPYSTRLCIVQGTEAGAPVAPGLDQNNNHFMIPLYQYQISVAGAITAGTDQREFAYFGSTIGTRTIFVPSLVGYNVTDVAQIALTDLYGIGTPNLVGPGIVMTDTKLCHARGRWVVPADIYRNVVIKNVYLGGNGNDIYSNLVVWNAACGEAQNTHTDTTGYAAEAMEPTVIEYSCHNTLAMATTPVVGDIFMLEGRRDATNVLDTVGANVYHIGWYITYESLS